MWLPAKNYASLLCGYLCREQRPDPATVDGYTANNKLTVNEMVMGFYDDYAHDDSEMGKNPLDDLEWAPEDHGTVESSQHGNLSMCCL